jgi:hypothetical protein
MSESYAKGYAQAEKILKDAFQTPVKKELDHKRLVITTGPKMWFLANRCFKTTMVAEEGPEVPPMLQGTPIKLILDHSIRGLEWYVEEVQ